MLPSSSPVKLILLASAATGVAQLLSPLSLVRISGLGGADDAIVVDLKHFNHLSVDKTTGIATVGSGNLLRDLVEGLNNAGRFMPHGPSPTVGVGGLIAVGGIGSTSRENGLSIDVMQEVEVVFANGTVTRATKNSNLDLFWAMSGAGASFGIATEFKFQTKPVLKELTTFSYNYSTTDKALLAHAVKAFNKLALDKSTSRKLGGSGNLAKNSFYVSGVFLGGADTGTASCAIIITCLFAQLAMLLSSLM
ncbi:hypothetical protein LRP88_04412 [Fusarium phalaenopsidis]